NQFRFQAETPVENGGMHLQIHLDALDGPVIGDYALAAGDGWGDHVIQTMPITPATGSHDVFITYSGGGVIGSLEWWKFTTNQKSANPTTLRTRSPGGHVDLTWRDNSGDETGYRIERSDNGGAGYSTLVTLPADSTSYSDNTAVGMTKYLYRVAG